MSKKLEVAGAIIAFIVPALLLYQQNVIFQRQNDLLEQQNRILAREQGVPADVPPVTPSQSIGPHYWPLITMGVFTLLTWAAVGLVLYDRRRARSASAQDLAQALADNTGLRSQLALRPTAQDLVTLQNENADLKHQLASKPVRTWPYGNVFTIQAVTTEHSPTATYRDKLRVTLTNTVGRDLHVWIPLWESAEVVPQQPFGSRFRLEGSAGWRNKDWVKDASGNFAEYSCLEVKAGFTCDCFIGLLPPTGKSLEERRRTNAPIGTAVFPVRIDGKLYDVPVDL